jgi:ubiquinone/menaquinone biosynthesis C-methylase UbiE
MHLFKKMKRRLTNLLHPKKAIEPGPGYDLWASTYDEETDNPIVYLDDIVFDEILSRINIEGKTVVDIGCGTGKHWEKILGKNPKEVIGYDVSIGMLKKLHQKYPDARAYITRDNRLPELADQSCDIIVSTLVIGYIKNLPETFSEWNRVLKRGGEILVTDFHPDALLMGADRSFKHGEQLFFIKNFIYPITTIETWSKKMNWKIVSMVEKKVDKTIKHFFDHRNSLEVYRESFNTNVIYGCHFQKTQ